MIAVGRSKDSEPQLLFPKDVYSATGKHHHSYQAPLLSAKCLPNAVVVTSLKLPTELSTGIGHLLGSICGTADLIPDPIPGIYHSLLGLGKSGFGRSRSAVFEKGVLLAGAGLELVQRRALVHGLDRWV